MFQQRIKHDALRTRCRTIWRRLTTFGADSTQHAKRRIHRLSSGAGSAVDDAIRSATFENTNHFLVKNCGNAPARTLALVGRSAEVATARLVGIYACVSVAVVIVRKWRRRK